MRYIVVTVNGGRIKEMNVFTKEELVAIGKALVLQMASVTRLSNKDGQPEQVRTAFIKVLDEIRTLAVKVQKEIDRLESQVKKVS